MAGTEATLPGGILVADHITLGVLTASVLLEVVHAVLQETDRASERERALPAHVMVYYCIAMAVHAEVLTREVLRWLLAGIRWLGGEPHAVVPASKAGISQARPRLGASLLDALSRRVVAPIAVAGPPGCVVPQPAGDESRRHDARCRRHGRECARVRATDEKPRRECHRGVSTAAR